MSEEMIREYGRAAWMEKADEIYEKVKKKIMELPITEAEQQMKQVDTFFQTILEGKSVTVETESVGSNTETKSTEQEKEHEYENCETMFEDLGVGKEVSVNTVCELIKNKSYSTNLKQDTTTFQKVKKHFAIKDGNQIYYFFDYTVFGGCKEGLAVCTDGIYFRMLSSKINVIKWDELGQYEFSLLNDKNLIVKKKGESNRLATMYFLQKQDGKNFLDVLWEMQNL